MVSVRESGLVKAIAAIPYEAVSTTTPTNVAVGESWVLSTCRCVIRVVADDVACVQKVGPVRGGVEAVVVELALCGTFMVLGGETVVGISAVLDHHGGVHPSWGPEECIEVHLREKDVGGVT